MKIWNYFAGVTVLIIAFYSAEAGRKKGGFLHSPSGKLGGDTKQSCHGPQDPGPCRAAMEVYFWDDAGKDCNAFYYGGCGGNGNRFDTYDECVKKCKKVKPSVQRKHLVDDMYEAKPKKSRSRVHLNKVQV